MSEQKPKRKISAALQAPNISDHGGHLATIDESRPLRRVSQDGQGHRSSTEQGPVHKVSTEYGIRRISGDDSEGGFRQGSDSNRKISYSMTGRKISFMSSPEILLKEKVRQLK